MINLNAFLFIQTVITRHKTIFNELKIVSHLIDLKHSGCDVVIASSVIHRYTDSFTFIIFKMIKKKLFLLIHL